MAAFSDEHFKVIKQTENGVTLTKVYKLSAAEKTEEIARMLSGEKITDAARAAAEALIVNG